MTENSNRIKITRRQAVNTLLFTTGLLASTEVTKVRGQEADTRSSDILPKSKVCVLTSQTVQGPYYFDPKLLRTDITEGKEGVPLKLLVQVIDTRGCTPIPRARVDVWHCDSLGLYSGYEGQGDDKATSTTGETFLRGTQITNTLGQVIFTTIYPGWYPERTPHIHLKVFLDQQTVLIAQLYLVDAISEYIYKNVRPYNTRTVERDTVNITDFGLRNSEGRDSFLNIKEEADYYLASIIIGVDRNARPTGEIPPGIDFQVIPKPTTPLVPGVSSTQ
ncbi:intradiol ring-cleavage dioxygenase [Scytonema tolypothrichoides VB-61278]|nr:intradiol ring-cleavage dioxygenase [Scytonema tolypothrichoides VB-61278]